MPVAHRLRSLAAAALLSTISSFAAHAQEGNAEAGAKVFAPCRACHQIGETAKNLVGPQLNGVIGRKAATAVNYNYSDAFKALDRVWTEEVFRKYIVDPSGDVPGTKMMFPGIKNEQQIPDLIAFLKQYGADGKKSQ